MTPEERAFWQFHGCLMEPWDGPACVTFTDGTLVGAVLDRNGLRPGRWWRTIDDRIILASESGVLDVPSAQVVAESTHETLFPCEHEKEFDMKKSPHRFCE